MAQTKINPNRPTTEIIMLKIIFNLKHLDSVGILYGLGIEQYMAYENCTENLPSLSAMQRMSDLYNQ